MRIRKNKKGDGKDRRRKSALLKFTAAAGTIMGTTLVGPGNTVYAKELDSASAEGVDNELESAASASQTASESLSIRASVYYERTGHDRRGRTD